MEYLGTNGVSCASKHPKYRSLHDEATDCGEWIEAFPTA